jgi:hypothetical protein
MINIEQKSGGTALFLFVLLLTMSAMAVGLLFVGAGHGLTETRVWMPPVTEWQAK